MFEGNTIEELHGFKVMGPYVFQFWESLKSFGHFNATFGSKHGKLDQTVRLPNIPSKNMTFLYKKTRK